MTYDTPYRVEESHRPVGIADFAMKPCYRIVHRDDGTICTCDEFWRAREVVEALNLQMAVK